MTLIDVLDSAVKIGFGALIGAISSYLTLKRTQSFEINKRKDESFNKLLDERKLAYIEFSALSHSLIQKYDYKSCELSGEDYESYITLHSKIQILAPDKIRYLMNETFNIITVVILDNGSNFELKKSNQSTAREMLSSSP